MKKYTLIEILQWLALVSPLLLIWFLTRISK